METIAFESEHDFFPVTMLDSFIQYNITYFKCRTSLQINFLKTFFFFSLPRIYLFSIFFTTVWNAKTCMFYQREYGNYVLKINVYVWSCFKKNVSTEKKILNDLILTKTFATAILSGGCTSLAWISNSNLSWLYSAMYAFVVNLPSCEIAGV